MYNMEPESWPYFNIVEQRALAGGLKGGVTRGQMAKDIDDDPVFLAKSSWETGCVMERFGKVAFTKTTERGRGQDGALPSRSAMSFRHLSI